MKILANNIAVLTDDTHISRWVEHHGRLDIAREYLNSFREFIKEGSTVVDAGAMIGDHTVTYSEFVGESGKVYAFEPNKEAYDCLEYNTSKLINVQCINQPLSNGSYSTSVVLDPNVGASHVKHDPFGNLVSTKLDDWGIQNLSFLKIDVEGFETRVLNGGVETIERCSPTILCEVNSGALLRAGTSSEALLVALQGFGYEIRITDPRLNFDDLQFDVLCTKKNH